MRTLFFLINVNFFSWLNDHDKELIIETVRMVSLFYEDLTPTMTSPGGYLERMIFKFRKLFRQSFFKEKPHAQHLTNPEFCFNLKIPTLSALLSTPDEFNFIGGTQFLDTSLVGYYVFLLLLNLLV